jgi:predicted nuclease of predicted toxin-antitoxin system
VRCPVDAQLPPALATWLISQGQTAEHVCDIGLAQASDTEIWKRASETSAVIVSKDEDFALRVQLGEAGPQVIWIRHGSARRAELLRRLGDAWPDVVAALERGERSSELA